MTDIMIPLCNDSAPTVVITVIIDSDRHQSTTKYRVKDDWNSFAYALRRAVNDVSDNILKSRSELISITMTRPYKGEGINAKHI